MTDQLNISLNNDASICSDIKSVCIDITEHYKTLIPTGPPLGLKPLFVIHNPSTPITFVNGLPTYYSIGLTENGRLYNQIAYQFAHELTHIYCDPRVTNWFIESVCEMASLYFLDYLKKKWTSTPPYSNWIDYAPMFSEYKNKRIQEVKSFYHIADGNDLENQFKKIKSSILDPYDRNANTIIAIKMSELFNKTINAWKLIPFIGQCTDKVLTDGCFYENSVPDYDKLVTIVPDDYKKISEEIRNLFI